MGKSPKNMLEHIMEQISVEHLVALMMVRGGRPFKKLKKAEE
jgi:hypothetical protein